MGHRGLETAPYELPLEALLNFDKTSLWSINELWCLKLVKSPFKIAVLVYMITPLVTEGVG